MAEERQKTTIKAFLPVMGFLLAVALAAIAYVLSAPVHQLLMEQLNNFPAGTTVQYVVAGVMWFVLLLFAYMLYAIFSPKPTKLTNEAQLKKEKTAKQKEDLARKKRQQEINRKMARDRIEQNQPKSGKR